MQTRRNVREDQDLFLINSQEKNQSLEIKNVIDQQRCKIKHDMENYEFLNGKYGLNISNLDDLLMEKNGRPIKSVILGNWRGGSTFVGEIVNSHPANFYHFEPLLDFGIVRIRGPPQDQPAIANINALFNCEYNKLLSYIEYGKTNPWGFMYNPRLWKQCVSHEEICLNPLFLSEFCRLFPFQSMKILRLTLNVAQVLLNDESLGVRMILLVRDPRGLMQSRKKPKWCQNSFDCSNTALLCNDMVSDYNIAVELKEKYPRTFKVLRYEDLSLDPFNEAEKMFEFYGLTFHPDVKSYLETHTKNNSGGQFSTFRDSKTAPFHWRNDLNFVEVEEIQRVCATAMKLWGYVLAVNETHQKEFNPILKNYGP
ncbi:carbohydrate sulfotransferase 5-like, partial [Microplitis demolitor]|uniref:carbohydrate sulfotransferase 5-like n=1 Tax=Microplitis demolitor TaxID=69319 RepID=UPI0004CC9581